VTSSRTTTSARSMSNMMRRRIDCAAPVLPHDQLNPTY
jgi:hypothetical protein